MLHSTNRALSGTHGGWRLHRSLLAIVRHDPFPVFLLTITQGERPAACILTSLKVSDFDQTTYGLLGILWPKGKGKGLCAG